MRGALHPEREGVERARHPLHAARDLVRRRRGCRRCTSIISCRRSSWCCSISRRRPRRSLKTYSCAGSTGVDIEVLEPLERGDVVAERVALLLRVQADVRRDRRQHVVAGEDELLAALEEADVARRVPGRPPHLELEAADRQLLAAPHDLVGLDGIDVAAHRHRRRLQVIASSPAGTPCIDQPLAHRREQLLGVAVAGADEVALALVDDDRGAAALLHLAGETVVVGMHVRDQQRLDVSRSRRRRR